MHGRQATAFAPKKAADVWHSACIPLRAECLFRQAVLLVALPCLARESCCIAVGSWGGWQQHQVEFDDDAEELDVEEDLTTVPSKEGRHSAADTPLRVRHENSPSALPLPLCKQWLELCTKC